MYKENIKYLSEFTQRRNLTGEITLAVGYGSSVIPQTTSNPAQNSRIDAIYVVKNSEQFHARLMEECPQDYSWIRVLGPKAFTMLQRTGGMISYNLTRYKNREFKYGVIEEEDLLDDLLYWKYLYVAGRFHKPHTLLIPPQSKEIQDALTTNLEFAVKVAAVLLQDHTFSEEELFKSIAEFSYVGDPRVEDPEKIAKLTSNKQGFKNHYKMAIHEVSEKKLILPTSKGTYTLSPDEPEKQLLILPQKLQTECAEKNITSVPQLISAVRKGVRKIVRTPAILQIPKGLFTAGTGKSIIYAYEKYKKSLRT